MSDIKDTKDFLFEIQKKRKISGAAAQTNLYDERKNVLDLKILVIVDISGSISQAQFVQFMDQIERIRGLSVVKVLETDDRVVSCYDYFRSEKSRIMRLQGGGGTEFSEAFSMATKMNPDACLVLTDGLISGRVRAPNFPVGWILTHDGQSPYDGAFGKVLFKLPPLNG